MTVLSISNSIPIKTPQCTCASQPKTEALPAELGQQILDKQVVYLATPSARLSSHKYLSKAKVIKAEVKRLSPGTKYRGGFKLSLRLDNGTTFTYYYLGLKNGNCLVQAKYGNMNTGPLRLDKVNYEDRHAIAEGIASDIRTLLKPKH